MVENRTQTDRFYITTAIDYPNANPHMGHAYEKIISDVFARWNRLYGKTVFFMTGLDEHGQKLEAAAQHAGLSPQTFVDQKAEIFKQLCSTLQLSNDYFIRTTDQKHVETVKNIFSKMLEKGDIYKGEYIGKYNVKEEAFVTDAQIRDGNFDPADIKEVREETYYFRMSKYQDRLLRYIKEENPTFIYPESRRNEILYRLEHEELKDLSVSRSTFDWGVPLPNDPKHVMYVWIDALSNYITGIDYPDGELYSSFWPADVHVIGKDILWFHTVIWPTLLMSIEEALPKRVYVHGFINDAIGEKMSKSKGNVVDPLTIIDEFGVDTLRYYLLRAIPSGEDGNFSVKDLIEKHNGELANDLGNLVMRVTKMIDASLGGTVSPADAEGWTSEHIPELSIERIHTLLGNFQYHIAIKEIMGYIRSINAFLNATEPWKQDDKEKRAILYTAIDRVHYGALLLSSFLPESSQGILEQLGPDQKINSLSIFRWNTYSYTVQVGDAMFPKKEYSEELTKEPETSAVEDSSEPTADVSDEGSVFPLEIRIGKIMTVEDHPKADKLYVLTVSFGDEQRQIIAGLKPYFAPDKLVGRVTTFLTNLEYAKLRGMESQGMVLIAEDAQDDSHLEFVEIQPQGDASADSMVGERVIPEGMKISENPQTISYTDFMAHPLEVENDAIRVHEKRLAHPTATVQVPHMQKGNLS